MPRALGMPALDRDWLAVAAAMVGLMLSLGTLLLYSFGVFVRPLTAEFGWSRTQLSGALALSQYTFALSAPVWGLLIDRFGPRRVLLPCVILLSGLVASLALLTPHLWHYYLVFGAVALCAGAASPVGYSAILVRKFDRHLGLSLGLALMGVGVGAAVLPPLAQALTSALGWREAYAVFGALTLVVTVPAALVATRGVSRPTKSLSGSQAVLILPMLKTRAFVLMCLMFLLLGVVSIGILANFVPILIGRGFAPPAAAQVAAVTGLVTILGRGGIGWLLDRFYAPYVIAAAGAIAGGASLLLAFGDTTASAYVVAALLGAVVGAEVDFTAFFVRRYFGSAAFGRLYGLTFGIFLIGTGTGPVLLGLSIDRFGDYRPGALLFAAACIGVVLLSFAMPPYPKAPARMLADSGAADLGPDASVAEPSSTG